MSALYKTKKQVIFLKKSKIKVFGVISSGRPILLSQTSTGGTLKSKCQRHQSAISTVAFNTTKNQQLEHLK
jgi:hypothetical protein